MKSLSVDSKVLSDEHQQQQAHRWMDERGMPTKCRIFLQLNNQNTCIYCLSTLWTFVTMASFKPFVKFNVAPPPKKKKKEKKNHDDFAAPNPSPLKWNLQNLVSHDIYNFEGSLDLMAESRKITIKCAGKPGKKYCGKQEKRFVPKTGKWHFWSSENFKIPAENGKLLSKIAETKKLF